MRDSGPRAAYSHCASVGREPPRHLAYASASNQLMHARGWSAASLSHGRGRLAGFCSLSQVSPLSDQSPSFVYPPASTKALKAAFVTSVRSIQKPLLIDTSWAGRSAAASSVAKGGGVSVASSEPMVNVPAGTQTCSTPLASVRTVPGAAFDPAAEEPPDSADEAAADELDVAVVEPIPEATDPAPAHPARIEVIRSGPMSGRPIRWVIARSPGGTLDACLGQSVARSRSGRRDAAPGFVRSEKSRDDVTGWPFSASSQPGRRY